MASAFQGAALLSLGLEVTSEWHMSVPHRQDLALSSTSKTVNHFRLIPALLLPAMKGCLVPPGHRHGLRGYGWSLPLVRGAAGACSRRSGGCDGEDAEDRELVCFRVWVPYRM